MCFFVHNNRNHMESFEKDAPLTSTNEQNSPISQAFVAEFVSLIFSSFGSFNSDGRWFFTQQEGWGLAMYEQDWMCLALSFDHFWQNWHFCKTPLEFDSLFFGFSSCGIGLVLFGIQFIRSFWPSIEMDSKEKYWSIHVHPRFFQPTKIH